MRKIGFIGTGVMGNRMCANFVKAGYPVWIFDVNPASYQNLTELGAIARETATQVAEEADVVLASLPNSRIVEAVMFGENGLFEGLKKGEGKVFIDLSSSEATSSKMISKKLKEIGVEMLDAPVSGGKEGAEAGTLSIMVGGPEEVFEANRDILGVVGNKIRYIGEAGSGDVMKAVNQILFTMNNVAAAEAFTLGTKAGVDPAVIAEVINSGSGQSYATTKKMINFTFKRNFTPGFTVDLMVKDANIALNLAKDLGIELPVAAAAHAEMTEAQKKDLGKKDCTAVINVLEEKAGVIVAPKAE